MKEQETSDRTGMEVEAHELNQELSEELRKFSSEEGAENSENTEKSHGRRRHRSSKGKDRPVKKKKKISAFRVIVIILLVLLAILVAAVVGFLILRSRGANKLSDSVIEESITAPEGAVVEDEGKSIVYKGERYWYNEDIITILCMGVDQTMDEASETEIGENGQADAIFLVALDKSNGKMSFVSISRDSMVDVNRYNVNGNFLGTERMQICLAYSYGDGKERSCLYTAEAVSRLMYGIPINAYAAIDYNGIGVLNDAIGGVTLEVIDNPTHLHPELQPGATVTLNGEQAHYYVRSRDTELLDSNNYRMARQRQYLTAFIRQALQKMSANFSLIFTLYQSATEYMVTDIGTSELSYLGSLAVQYGFSEGDMRSIPGEIRQGAEYAEFIPDEEALFELILDVFYVKE